MTVLNQGEMKLVVNVRPFTQTYAWSLYDGPDGIDFYEGEASSLGECFEQVVESRVLNSLSYKNDESTN